jgi:predicted GIY-YIG superfamily endonuclease
MRTYNHSTPRRRFRKTEPVVYLLHLSEKLAGRSNHYMGTTHSLDRRLHEHSALATGAAMLRAARSHGITWVVVRTWPGGHALERQLKGQKNHKHLCPICRGEMDDWAIQRSKGHPVFQKFTGRRRPMR